MGENTVKAVRCWAARERERASAGRSGSAPPQPTHEQRGLVPRPSQGRDSEEETAVGRPVRRTGRPRTEGQPEEVRRARHATHASASCQACACLGSMRSWVLCYKLGIAKMPNPEYSNHLKVRSKARSSSCFKLIGKLKWGRVRVDPGVAGGGRPGPTGRLSLHEAGVGGVRRRAAALGEAGSSGGAAIGRWGARDGEPREERASAASCALAAQPRQYSRTYKSAGVAAPARLRSAIPSLASRAKMR